MTWIRKFPAPIRLNDGRALETLGDARAVILRFPERRRDNIEWQNAAKLLVQAAKGSATGADISRAVSQLKIVLRAEELL